VESNDIPLNYSIEAFAAKIGIGRTKAWEHVKAGDVAVVRMGRRPTVTAQELERVSREGLPQLRKAKATAD